MKKRTQSGFTLYELLVTMLIVGVVMTLGIPNLTQFTQNSRMTSTANDLHASFQLARSEAARSKTNITICASSNSMDADAACGGTWEQGFIVFVDANDPGSVTRDDDPSEPIIRAHPAVDSSVTVNVANAATFFSFAPTGLGRGNIGANTALSQVVICDKRGTVLVSGDYSAARLLTVTPLGRAVILRDKPRVDTALAAISGGSCP